MREPLDGQRGYIDLDFTGLFVGLVIVGIVVGLGLAWLVPWVWGIVKPLLHALTT